MVQPTYEPSEQKKDEVFLIYSSDEAHKEQKDQTTSSPNRIFRR